MRQFVAAAASIIAVTACASTSEPSPSPHLYFTHCGVSQTEIGGVPYYPTEIYLDGVLVGVGSDPGDPRSMWVPPAGDTGALSAAIGQFDFNTSGGQVRVFEDGTARFSLGKTDVEVALTRDPSLAASVFEGCY